MVGRRGEEGWGAEGVPERGSDIPRVLDRVDHLYYLIGYQLSCV